MKKLEELKAELKNIPQQEKWKHAMMKLPEAEAHCTWFKDCGREEVLAEESEKIASEFPNRPSDAMLSKKARASEHWKQASKEYKEQLEVKIYIKNLITFKKMENDMRIATIYHESAKLKAGIEGYGEGS